MAKLRFLPLALIAAGLSVPAAFGAGASESIKIAGQANLVAPATVYLTVTYTCLPTTGTSSTGTGHVVLHEPLAAAGSAGFLAVCDDRNHTETVGVEGGWTPGTGDASGSVCSFFCSLSSPTEVTIR
jgi:hypothetical protein